MEPQELARQAEGQAGKPPGDDETVAGYGVFGVAFASGHVLALRRFTGSSVGPAYTSLWHRTPQGEWSITADCSPDLACPRYFGKDLASSGSAPVRIVWTGPRSFEVTLDDRLHWTVDLRPSLGTRVVSGMARMMPDALWRNRTVLRVMGRMAGPMLGAGPMALTGTTPNGQWFRANPRLVWTIARSRATWRGEDLGAMVRLKERVALGGFVIPRAPLFAFGRTVFEAYDGGRHSGQTSRAAGKKATRDAALG